MTSSGNSGGQVPALGQEYPRSPEVSANPFAAEESRIREAYAARDQDRACGAFDPAQALCAQQREQKLRDLLAARGWSSLANARILEVGCGTGAWLRAFVRWGALPENVVGVDLLLQRLAEARRLCPSGIRLICGNAARLEARDGSFDLVLQSTMFTSILNPGLKRQVAREMLRVLLPSGCIVWYDFHVNNPRNPDVRGIKRGEIAALFPGCRISLYRLTLAPPLGRPVARISPRLYDLLSAIRPLCTHYLGIISRK